MSVERVNYRHICKDNRNDPNMVAQVMEEAIGVFKKRKRGINGYEFCYNDGHPLTLDNLKEISSYFAKIWNNEEIYLEENK